MKLPEIGRHLAADFRTNPNLLVAIRADENGKYKLVADILNECEQIGITSFSLHESQPANP